MSLILILTATWINYTNSDAGNSWEFISLIASKLVERLILKRKHYTLHSIQCALCKFSKLGRTCTSNSIVRAVRVRWQCVLVRVRWQCVLVRVRWQCVLVRVRWQCVLVRVRWQCALVRVRWQCVLVRVRWHECAGSVRWYECAGSVCWYECAGSV